MLIPIEVTSLLFPHNHLATAALDEAVTAFNSELTECFASSGQVVGIPPAGVSNVVKLEATGGSGPAASVAVTVALAVLTGTPASVEAIADGFTSNRFPATTIRVVTRERLAHLRGLGLVAAAQSASHEHAAERIAGIIGQP